MLNFGKKKTELIPERCCAMGSGVKSAEAGGANLLTIQSHKTTGGDPFSVTLFGASREAPRAAPLCVDCTLYSLSLSL